VHSVLSDRSAPTLARTSRTLEMLAESAGLPRAQRVQNVLAHGSSPFPDVSLCFAPERFMLEFWPLWTLSPSGVYDLMSIGWALKLERQVESASVLICPCP
jgi:hypothetical protein